MGVLESSCGSGIASKPSNPNLKIADTRKIMVYTDTVTREDVVFYEHFGFQRVVEVAAEPATGITVWALQRPVQASS